MRKEFFALVLVLFSCGAKDNKPSDVLSQDEMVNVLANIYVSEDKVARLGLNADSAKKVFDAMQGKVFEKTGVADSVFRKSFDYYMDHPKELELIYSALVDSLSLREQRTPYRAEENK